MPDMMRVLGTDGLVQDAQDKLDQVTGAVRTRQRRLTEESPEP